MKIFNSILTVLLVACMTACSSDEPDDPGKDPSEVAVESVTVTPATTTLETGQNLKLQVKVAPADAPQSVTWTTSDKAVADVDAEGNVTAVAEGTATITAKAGTKTATCVVTVTAVPVPVTLTLETEQLDLFVDESKTLAYTVDPADTKVVWSTSDDRIVTVDENGTIYGVARGSAVITATAGDATATCNVRVVRPMQVGDFYYADGSHSANLSMSKEVIGVIFWVGDPTADDAALKRDHPECTHGLVVAAFPDTNPYAWQPGYSSLSQTVGAWVAANATDYQDITSEWMKDERRNKIAGYNNTKAIEAYNASDYGQQVPVLAIARVQAFRQSNPAPASSSDWFLPAVKELTLLINDDYDGEVFEFNNISSSLCLTNRNVINEKLAQIENAELIGCNKEWSYDYWSSTEWYYNQAYHVSADDGSVMGGSKDGAYNQQIRCVLAF